MFELSLGCRHVIRHVLTLLVKGYPKKLEYNLYFSSSSENFDKTHYLTSVIYDTANYIFGEIFNDTYLANFY